MHLAFQRFHRRLAVGFLSLGLFAGLVGVARADAPARVFVASTGDDANVGSPASPKRNFQAAHNAVAAGGEIVVLNTAGYGLLTITKSVTVTVPPGVTGFINVPSGTTAINIVAGLNDTVTLRGLVIEGAGANSGGISTLGVGTLRVEDCVIRQVDTAISAGNQTNVHLIVNGGSIFDVNNGIQLEPFANNNACDAVVTGCRIDNATIALTALITSNYTGSTSRLTADHCVLTHCGTGVYVYGPGAACNVDDCSIIGNTTGLLNNGSGGQLYTRGNNTVVGNSTDGSFNASLAPL